MEEINHPWIREQLLTKVFAHLVTVGSVDGRPIRPEQRECTGRESFCCACLSASIATQDEQSQLTTLSSDRGTPKLRAMSSM
jgi:hypothetical protein